MAAGAQAQTHEQLAVQQDGALLEGNGQLLAEIDIGNIAAGDGIQEQAVLAGVLIGRGGNALDGGLFNDIEGRNDFAVDILGLEFLQGLDDNSAEGAAVSGAGADVIAIGANGLQGGIGDDLGAGMDAEGLGFLTAANADINIALGDGLSLGDLLGGEEVAGADADNTLDYALFHP